MARTKCAARKPVATEPMQRISKKTAPQTAGIKKARRYKPGTRALMNIKKAQRSTELYIKKRPFRRIVRELTMDAGSEVQRWTRDAIGAMHEGIEAYVVDMMQESLKYQLHAKRVTLDPSDIVLALKAKTLSKE